MEDRIKINHVFKSSNPEELIVFHAGSSKDEICFYFNDEQYVSAKDNYDGTFSINYGEDTKEENESEKSTIKENPKKYFKFIFLDLDKVEILCCSIILILLLAIIGNILVCFLLFHLINFLAEISTILKNIYKNKPISLKSKHSAEHMMVKFLESKRRLPKDISEIKSMSRFSNDCGSRKIIREYAEDFVHNVFTSLIAIIIGSYIINDCKNEILSCIILISVYIVIGFIIGILMKKYNKLNFIIKPIQKVLSNLVQCCNTTRKIEDNDIVLAYYAVREWMKIVYPEFYNEDEDTFCKCEES